eukprot:10014473-Prorocentrum_lima.AAC.1
MKEEERATNPNYCVWEQALMDLKNKNKGYFWKSDVNQHQKGKEGVARGNERLINLGLATDPET